MDHHRLTSLPLGGGPALNMIGSRSAFQDHAADALAVMDAHALRRPAMVTVSRGLDATVISAMWTG